MATNPVPQTTDFSKDVFGRYVCHGLDEALRSADRAARADALPFDFIILGAGPFGSILAQHLFDQNKTHSHRILMLEAGPFVLPEHVQNLPMIGLNVPPPTSLADLRNGKPDGFARAEVWGLPWHSPVKFPGIAYCIGGRSLYRGGWSPQPLESELPTTRWPASVVRDLAARGDGYFSQAADQIGTGETNDFIFGGLHTTLRKKLFDGLQANRVNDAVPLSQMPLRLKLPARVTGAEREIMKLEAPLAVQSRTRAGPFPFNKFSTVPPVTRARCARRGSIPPTTR